MGKPKNSNTNEANLKSYVNIESSAALRRVDITQAADGGHFMFFQGRKNVPVEDFKEILQEHLPTENYISTTMVNDKPIIVVRTPSSPQNVLKQWEEATGQALQPYKPEKSKASRDLIKMRGTVGNIGQVFMILSGFFDSEKKGKFNFKTNPDAAAKVTSAVISVFGNGINSYYGVQRNTDDTRLKHAKGLVNQNLGMGNNALTGNLPSKYTRITRPNKEDQPTWMEKNSIKVSNGVKFFGKYALTKASDSNLKLSGQMSLAAKIVTLAGKDEDPYKLEKDQSFLTRIRRQSNAISGVLEWIANVSLFAGSVAKVPADAPKRKYQLYDFDSAKMRDFKDVQWWQMLGATSFFVSLTAKAMAPFTSKTLDVEELCTHSTIALVESIPEGKHTDELTRLTAQLLETRELPELKERGFASTFTSIANRLESYHGIAVDAPTPSSNTHALERYAAQGHTQPVAKTDIEERPTVASTLAKEPRAETMAERIASESLSTATPQAGV